MPNLKPSGRLLRMFNAAAILFLGAGATAYADNVLSVTPVFQQYSDWCWLSSGEMIFRFYNIPTIDPVSYQCGILVVAGIPCVNLSAGYRGDANATMVSMFNQYPMIMQQKTGTSVQQLHAQLAYYPLPFSQIQSQIDAGHPFVAGISPSGFATGFQPQHAVVIIGYSQTSPGRVPIPSVYVNDPFPYSSFGMPNPYTSHGALQVAPGEYQAAISGFTLLMHWVVTILVTPNP